MKNFGKSVMLICLFGFALSLSAQAAAQITQSDIEMISWKNQASPAKASYSLFTLKNLSSAKYKELYAFINGLLYEGKTAQDYLNDVKLSYKDWHTNEYHGENFTWDIKGKFLLLKRVRYGASGSRYEVTESYIIDTKLVKRLTVDDILKNQNSPALLKIVWNRLSKTDNFEWLSEGPFMESFKEKSYTLLIEKSAIVFHWNKGSLSANAAGAFEAVLSRSEIEPYLTQIGKELLK